MRKLLISIGILALSVGAASQSLPVGPKAYTGYCLASSGVNVGKYVPIAAVANASVVPNPPNAITLYGFDSANYDPLNCDSNGNLSANNLGGIPFVNNPAPALSDVICYDGVQYTPCPPSAGPAQILYITNTASSISTYNVWDTVPLASQFTVAASIPATNAKTLVKAFATISGYPNVTVIPAGEWQADTYAQLSSNANTTILQIDVYDRTSLGVETLLFSFADLSMTGTSPTHYTAEAVEPAFSVASTDRLVIKYSMTHNTGSSITGTLYGGGSTNYSHVHTPIGTNGGDGITKTCSTLITTMTVTNGIVTALTCP